MNANFMFNVNSVFSLLYLLTEKEKLSKWN